MAMIATFTLLLSIVPAYHSEASTVKYLLGTFWGTEISVNPENGVLYGTFDYGIFATGDYYNAGSSGINTGGKPAHIAIDPIGSAVYVTHACAECPDSSNVTVVEYSGTDPTNVIHIANAGSFDSDITFSPTGRNVYVASDDFISVINSTTKEVFDRIPGIKVQEMAVDDRSGTLYAIDKRINTLYAIDTKTNQIIDYVSIESEPDKFGNKNELTSISVNPNTNSVYIVSSSVHGEASSSDYSFSQSHIIVVNGTSLDIVSQNIKDISGPAVDIEVNPSTNRIYAMTGNGFAIIDGSTDQIIDDQFVVGNDVSPKDIAINPKTNAVYVLTETGLYIVFDDPELLPFTISQTYNGKDYNITGFAKVNFSSFDIHEKSGIELNFDRIEAVKGGIVELLLPKTLIDDIRYVSYGAEDWSSSFYPFIDTSNATFNLVRFTFPGGTSLGVAGTIVAAPDYVPPPVINNTISGRYVDPQTGLEIQFPEGWHGKLAGIPIVGPQGIDGYDIKPIDVAMFILQVDRSYLPTAFMGVITYPGEVFSNDITRMSTPTSCTETYEYTTINGVEAAHVFFDCNDFGQRTKVNVYVFMTVDKLVIVAYSAGGDALYNANLDGFEQSLLTLNMSGLVDYREALRETMPLNTETYTVSATGDLVEITLQSSSKMSNFDFSESEKRVGFRVEATDLNKSNALAIIAIDQVLEPPYTVTIDGNHASQFVVAKNQNTGENTIEINYTHHVNDNAHDIAIVGSKVIPEFPIQMIVILAILLGSCVLMGRMKFLTY